MIPWLQVWAFNLWRELLMLVNYYTEKTETQNGNVCLFSVFK